MGHSQCRGEHDYAVTKLGAGMVRHECRRCRTVLIDVDAAEDGSPVTAPGLFGPARPTIFTVLAEERRWEAKASEEKPRSAHGGPAYAFRGGNRHG